MKIDHYPNPKNSKALKAILRAGASIVLIAGCAPSANGAREGVAGDAWKRIDLDLGGGTYPDGIRGDYTGGVCMKDQPWDPVTGDDSAHVDATKDFYGRTTAVVTPNPAFYIGLEPLVLAGFEDYGQSVQPVDQYSRDLFETYGC